MTIQLQLIIPKWLICLIVASSMFIVAGCSGIRAIAKVPPRVEVIPFHDRNESISVGIFENNMTFDDAKKIRANVSLDRPVSQVVRDFVIEELQREGYKIAENSSYEVTGNVYSLVYGPGTVISFTISTKLNDHRRPVFKETFRAGSDLMDMTLIWNTNSQIEEIRTCIKKFITTLPTLLEKFKSQHKSSASVKKIYVTDLTIFQQGRDLVFEYTLMASDSDTSDEVILEYSLDSGKTWKKPKGLFGDFGKNVFVGKNKQIIWSVLDELPGGIVGDADFRVETLREK